MDRQRIEAYYATYNRENPEALAAFYCPDAELVSPGGTLRGAGEVLASYRSLIGMFRDQMQPVAIDIDGATAVVDIIDRFTAKQDVDDFMGMTLARGDSFELHLRGTYTCDGDRFRRIHIDQLPGTGG